MDKKLRILIVDDFPTVRRIVKDLLHDLGFDDTAEAEHGHSALSMLRSGHFDFLVTDWNMPHMTGIELVRAVREDPALASLPVLMVTAEAHRNQIVEAVAAGANGYLLKPFTAQTFKKKLERILEPVSDVA